MESAQLLDILGNGNRRKILQLLASRPCYMSEIAERLDVGAKAILGHLLLLEQAGLIEANVDEQRRKYFHITDNLRLEVFVSPYSFEVETTTIAISVPKHYVKARQAITGLKALYGEIQGLLEQRRQVMQEYQQVQSDITEAMGHSMDAIEEVAADDVEAEILYALLKGPMNQRALSMQLGILEYMLEGYLERMLEKEIIKEDTNNYSIG
ncbi:MAG: ArsR family transcriptional regulator [Candidatus Methanoperedens sp.]|nr:ArsR family transcriptional regulator [Candidatus Methanoperedens sp.]MCZ7394695.1 ArsR family transcriptional regulator [Candidatus Methanoperedens sp.]